MAMATATREGTVEAFLIEGCQPLSGTIRPAGNKNAALPILAACLLTGEPVTLENVPHIRDVEEMLELIAALGVDVEWQGPNTVRVWAAEVNGTKLDPELCTRIRASILLAGPLLARFGAADVPPPGGDVIGRRRVDTHLMAFAALGADVQVDREYRLRAPDGLDGAEIHLDEASVTGTENALMAAARARGTTVIMNAACEPHVQDLCHLLCKMGVGIEGIGSNVLVIEGADALWPMFPADLTSIAVAVATQAKGTVLIFEKMFENRLVFTDKLVSMGARIILCDPHRAVVTGPARLYGERMASPDIRAGMAMLIAS